MNRKAKHYKTYLDASAEGTKTPIPYSTWRRWLISGRVTAERLQELGIKIKTQINPHRRQQTERAATLEPQGENSFANTFQGNQPDARPSTSSSLQPDGNEAVPEVSPSTSFRMTNPSLPTYDAGNGSNDTDSGGTSNRGSTLPLFDSDGSCMSSVSDGSIRYDYVDLSFSDEDFEDLSGADSNLSSLLKSKFIGPDSLNEPLHPHLNVTKFETLLMILHLSMRHKMTDAFLEDLLSFVNQVIGIPNALRVSKHLFHKLFMCGMKPVIHFYCPNCSVYLGNESAFSNGLVQCESCDWSNSVSSHNGGNYFLSLSLRDQIREVLSRPNIKMVSRDQSLENVVSDVIDGKEYKSLCKDGKILSNPNALTLTFNTDGAPVFKSGPNSLWPIHFFINEIHVSQRYNSDSILLGGIWYGTSQEADVQLFLKPFIEELKELEKCGVVWKNAEGVVIESPVYLFCCCTDSVAKPKVQSLMQFNGTFGCGYCLHPNTSITVMEKVESRSGIVIRGEEGNEDREGTRNVFRRKKIMRYLRGRYGMRSNKELRKYMQLAERGVYDHIMGATGVSVVCELKYFNVVFWFIIDYMHAILLGTVKRLAGYWFDSTNKGNPYYIGTSIGRVDMRIEGITLPSGFRPPRSMSDRCHWKANEWRAFLFYFGLPVLANILPLPYYNHFKKLVIAVYTLSKESILTDEIDDCHNLLQDFVWEYQDLYGEVNMVYNVHITGHLAQLVSKMGPLWAYSAFPFESANGRLVKLSMGTKGVATQICRKYIMTSTVPKLIRNHYQAKEEILNFCWSVIGNKYLNNAVKGNNDETMLGRQFYFSLNDLQKQAFIDKNILVPEVVLTVNRAVVGKRLYHSRITTRQKKAFDSCVRLCSGEFALIDLIVCYHGQMPRETETKFLVTKLNIATDPSPLLVPHIKQCSIDSFGDVELVCSTEIVKKMYFL